MEAAIYEDCHSLLEDFINEGSAYFESFCTKWENRTFQHIYAAQTSVVEVMQTTLTIFHMAKRSICAKDEFGKYLSNTEGNEERNLLRRIGGIYLMYAVYFKQPTKEYIKISVSLETWREMTLFVESLSGDPKMDEVRYTFWRLYQADAFRFTAMDYCLGLEGLADYDKITEEHQEVEQTEVVRVKAKHKLLLIPEVQETLKEMTSQEEKYNELKKSITQSQNQTTETLPPTEIFRKMQSMFADIKGILDGNPIEIGDLGKNISTTRKELKRKAAGITDYIETSNSENESLSSSSSWEEDHSIVENKTPTPKKTKKDGQKTKVKKRSFHSDGILYHELSDTLKHDLKNISSDDDEVNESGDCGDTTENSNSASTTRNLSQNLT